MQNTGQERRQAQPALAPTTASQPPAAPAAAVSHLATSSVVDVGTVGEVAQQELEHLLEAAAEQQQASPPLLEALLQPGKEGGVQAVDQPEGQARRRRFSIRSASRAIGSPAVGGPALPAAASTGNEGNHSEQLRAGNVSLPGPGPGGQPIRMADEPPEAAGGSSAAGEVPPLAPPPVPAPPEAVAAAQPLQKEHNEEMLRLFAQPDPISYRSDDVLQRASLPSQYQSRACAGQRQWQLLARSQY